MSTTRLIATAIIVGSLLPTLVPNPARADPCLENAVRWLQRFGGKVDRYEHPAKEPTLAQPAKPLSPWDPKTVTFFNTNLSDLDLVLVSDALLQIGNLTRMDLRYTRLKGESLGVLAGIASLRELELSSTPISSRGLLELTLLGQLTSIGLDNTSLPYDSSVVFQCKFQATLRSLHLAGARIVDPGLRPLGANGILQWISHFSELESLDLSQTLAVPGSPEAEHGVSSLQPLTCLQKLTALNLANNNLNERTLTPLLQLTNLTVLSLAGNRKLKDSSLVALWPSIGSALDRLTKLNLSGTQLTDAGLAAIVSRNINLVDINISSTYTLTSSAGAISLGRLNELLKLDISGTGVNDAVFRTIWEGGRLNKLDSLDISGTMVTDRGLTSDKPQPAVGFMLLDSLYCADTKVTTGGVNRRNALRASIAPPATAAAATPQAHGEPSPSRARLDATLRDMRMRP